MTTRSAARKSRLFLDPAPERMTSKASSQRRKKVGGGLVDAVVDGERVLLATAPEPLERGIQIQIVTALTAAGIRVLQHRIFPCHACGQRPTKQTGLGEFAADVLCVVPPYGRACFVEVKRPSTRNAKRDAEQREWAKWIRHYGGVAGVATNVDEAFALVALARRLP